ncbi:hypothetical protein B0I35DRAFT_121673 [Stachybotrys elegans]|uniref:Uncharacterized protein n=1 Tax=Stachybotrys elegans TaxID=80388 RepID=A0A8K0WUR9_9HYPO|nr:hypothetical protein B0I35DRAFT_121673 [Stachybotrys elegans]
MATNKSVCSRTGTCNPVTHPIHATCDMDMQHTTCHVKKEPRKQPDSPLFIIGTSPDFAPPSPANPSGQAIPLRPNCDPPGKSIVAIRHATRF